VRGVALHDGLGGSKVIRSQQVGAAGLVAEAAGKFDPTLRALVVEESDVQRHHRRIDVGAAQQIDQVTVHGRLLGMR
jgi:hypothetical protein